MGMFTPAMLPVLSGLAGYGYATALAKCINEKYSMSEKPAVILVHGFWGDAAHWGKVIVELARKGYTSIHAVGMPLTSLADDAERTRKMIAQQKGPVLLVGHAYGGAVITEAGNQQNVVGLVYIAAFAPDAGESPGGITLALKVCRSAAGGLGLSA